MVMAIRGGCVGLAMVALGVLVGLGGCGEAKVKSEKAFAATAPRPAMIYVTDFELEAASIGHEEGAMANRPGPAGRVSERLSGASRDPNSRARQIVDLMADALVKELTDAGFKAARLGPGMPLPTEGWLVRGVFTEVQEGNRLKRAMVGFGTGQTDLQVISAIDDLSRGAPRPLYQVETEASSGDRPGGAATLAFNPYGAAARFVMAGKDLEKNVRQTAKQIAAQVSKRVEGVARD